MSSADLQTLLQFFKVMANESRLKLVGVLAQRECSVEELAALLRLKEPTISHHLSRLKASGLVTMRPEGNTHFYRLDSEALQALNKAILTQDHMPVLAATVSEDSWEDKVLKTYLEGGQLKQIPASRRKRVVILKWLVKHFDMETIYPEREVNQIIQQYHPDSETLRRELIGYRMMQRDQGIYWRLPETEWSNVEQ
jgi:DNA-binding transcriptional ArsR family regulator